MLSKFARASSSVGIRFLYQKSSFIGTSRHLSSSSFAHSTTNFQFSQNSSSYFKNFLITIPNTRLMSKSLAEEILKQKQEEQSKKEDEKKSGDEEKDKKNFWKYWKIYAVVFTLFTGSCVNLAYLYCKFLPFKHFCI